MIPKIIHYCWLSNDPIPQRLQDCMETWKKIMPEYQWVKWDLTRFDLNSNIWVKEAFEKKKYAFAADYIRLYAIYTMGGIYLDMDVEVLKSFDPFLDNDFFTFSEYYPYWFEKYHCEQYLDREGHRIKGEEVLCYSLQAAVIGGEKNSPHVKELMSFYETHHFVNPDGSLNMRPLAPGRYAVTAENWGFIYRDIEQKLPNRVTIYPSRYLAAVTGMRCEESYAVHHCAHSWADPPKKESCFDKIKHKSKQIIEKIFILKKMIHWPDFRKISEYRTYIMGVAILWVLLFHTCGIFIFPSPISNFQSVGYLGVDLFFFVSAYGLYFSQKSSNKSLFLWYSRRFLRIFPSFIIVTTLLFFLKDLSLKSYIYEISFLGFFMPWAKIGSIFWYIPAILIFYLIFPYLFRHLYMINKYYIFIFLLSFVLYYISVIFNQSKSWTGYYSFFIARIPVFLLGLLYANKEEVIISRYNNDVEKKIILLIVSAFFFFIILYENVYVISLLRKEFIFIYLILSLPILFVSCDLFSRCLKKLSSFIYFCGRYSLEIYLLHTAFIRITGLPLLKESINANVLMASAFVLSIPSGYLLYQLTKALTKQIEKRIS